ncbi:MAG: ABC transporter ATP-binding protein [Candidatus Marinimicrobia bacterium]|nr:ABC transporter ATP-binding protein [Candidatus Neomarinimicrobiota bacterium]
MIEFQTASKTYGQTEVLQGLTLAVEAGETVVLIGPSGGGKTTALKLVNGLVQPTSGTVLVDGRSVATWDLLALRRSIGYVIQEVGLFPHWTVAANVGLLPRLMGWGAGEIDRRVNELLELVALDPGEYRQRFPRELSGGQTQRVGVARALALKPGILLMDEPFGALDPLLRAQLQQELLRILAEVHTTTLLVTHDLPEAFRMADRIAVLVDGQLQQVDTPAELRRAPKSEFIRRLMAAELMEGGSQ